MIKNIVFDMGMVLLNYEPLAVCYAYTKQAEEIALLGKELFFSEEWILLDRGVITEEEALNRVQLRLPNERLRWLAKECLAHWHEYNLRPDPAMEELVRSLKEAGYRIYLLSNASHRLRVYETRIPGYSYFDGMVVSAEEQLLKPEPEIYERLFARYGLRPEECFFIDDKPENVEGGKACGMDGYCFADGNLDRLRAYVKKYLKENGLESGCLENLEQV